MKRVIKASFARKHSGLVGLRDKLRCGEADISYLETCKTVEDVKNHKYECFNMRGLINRLEQTSDSKIVEMLIDKAVDQFAKMLESDMGNYHTASRNVRLFKQYMDELSQLVEVKLIEDSARIPIVEGVPEDLVDFVDLVCDTTGSHYFATGRGGSWTAYNIRTPDGVEMQVSKDRSGAYYTISIVGI